MVYCKNMLPFLALGLFTTQVLDFIKTRQKLLRYAIKAGGVLLIINGYVSGEMDKERMENIIKETLESKK
ncbi:MAG: hypothetical protein RSF33_03400 [Hydrogenoanaerobacterium sp.]